MYRDENKLVNERRGLVEGIPAIKNNESDLPIKSVSVKREQLLTLSFWNAEVPTPNPSWKFTPSETRTRFRATPPPRNRPPKQRACPTPHPNEPAHTSVPHAHGEGECFVRRSWLAKLTQPTTDRRRLQNRRTMMKTIAKSLALAAVGAPQSPGCQSCAHANHLCEPPARLTHAVFACSRHRLRGLRGRVPSRIWRWCLDL